MILRNVASRHGRKAFAAPVQRCCLRSLTSEAFQSRTASIEDTLQSHSNETDSIAAHLNELHIARGLASPAPPKQPSVRQLAHQARERVRKNWELQKHIKRRTGKVGSVVERHYQPHQLLTHPPKPEDVTLELLMASQSHLGHATSLWNPMNQRYIFGVRQGIHIISLETTAAHLRRAAKIVEGVAYHGGLILFVGTRSGQGPCVVNAAEMAKGCHLFEKWIPGSITNGDQILSRCTVRAIGANDEPIEGFEEKIADWKALQPDLVVCLNPLENYILLHECGLNNIPTIGVIDTDADPTWVTYPIPANDDSIRCAQVIAGVLGRAGQEGQRKRLEAAAKGTVTWLPPPGLGKPFNEAEENKRKEAEAAAIGKEGGENKKKRYGAISMFDDDL